MQILKIDQVSNYQKNRKQKRFRRSEKYKTGSYLRWETAMREDSGKNFRRLFPTFRVK